jgi:hypothetical protein
VQLKKLLYILFALLIVACAEKKEEPAPPPSDLLSEEEMAEVLVDLHIMEASINVKMTQESRLVKDTAHYQDVYKEHKISKAQLDESFRYYASKPEKLSGIYEIVVSKLNQMQTAAMQEAAKDTSNRPKLPSPPPVIK